MNKCKTCGCDMGIGEITIEYAHGYCEKCHEGGEEVRGEVKYD